MAILVAAVISCPSVGATQAKVLDPNQGVSNTQGEGLDRIKTVAFQNYLSRNDHRKNYAFIEEVRTSFAVSLFWTNTYENILVNGSPYRKHVAFNGQALTPEEETAEREKNLIAHSLPGSFRVSLDAVEQAPQQFSAQADPQERWIQSGATQIDKWRRRLGTTNSLCTAVYPVRLWDFRLPLEKLEMGSRWRMLRSESLKGRDTYVIEVLPPGEFDERYGELRNFRLLIWIDQEESEIAKVDATAIQEGYLSSARFYEVNHQKSLTAKLVASIREYLPNTVGLYGRGTRISMEWGRISPGVWVPTQTVIVGQEIQTVPRCGKDKVTKLSQYSIPAKMEVVYSDYKKFRAETRIFFPEEVSGPELHTPQSKTTQ